MGINFQKPSPQPQPQAAQQTDGEIQLVKNYDIIADRQDMNARYINSQEVDRLTSKIAVNDLETIVTFGADVAEKISKASDVVLQNVNMEQIDDSGELLKALAKVMERFEPEELQDKPGLFDKLFASSKKQLEKILSKYNSMGSDVERIYIELKKYESEIKLANRRLNDIFDANVEYYHELVKYILACEQGCKELESYISQRESDLQATGDESISFEIQSLNQALMMLEQRTQDLRTAESVAMQSIPMIKTMEFTNVNLIRKINSAFIVTLPVFKQALAQAIMLKRQKIQAESMAALDEKTNELLIRNAQNTVEQSKLTARLASGSSIKVDTLEKTWQTIVNGIEETKQIQEEARRNQAEERMRLENIKREFNKMYDMPR
ncbi:MAG: toxic anion resistance protein [Lachnospiraceae bacterium]|nr:toxic anion resistance protein [Lachnospiraceae bacterium]